MSNILKGLNEGRSYGRDSWDSNMPGYQGDYGGAENFGRRNREWDEDDRIDARIRAEYEKKKEYEQNGKFWLKLKDSQRHLPAGPFTGKQAANTAAIELLKQQPELKGNLLITAYGPDETQAVAEVELDEAKAKKTEEDIFLKGKKVGSITTTTTKGGITFYTVQVGNSFVAGLNTREEALKHLKRLYRDYYSKQGVAEDQLDELSNNTLASYKKKAGADATQADKRGDYARGNKRMSGIMKATKKEFDNDAKSVNEEELDENLRKWFKEKWVRFGPDGKIRGDCARGDDSEGKPKCLPQSKAHSLGKKGRASAASRKRREDPNPERSGKAINVNTKKKTNEAELDEACWKGYHKEGNKKMFGKTYPNCVKNTNEEQEQLDEKCWDTHKQVGMKSKGGKQVPNCVPKESIEEQHSASCPHCGGEMVSEELMNEKKDACYYKVKSRYKVWPSAYASGALVKCRKKGASNWGNGGKSNESVDESEDIRPQGKILKKLHDIAYSSPALTFQNFRQSGKEAIITDAIMACKVLKHHYLQNKNQPTAQIIYNLENELDNFMRGRKLPTPDGNEYTMDLSDLLKGTLGKMRFQQKVDEEQLDEKWTKKYKDSINCSNPKGFSQKAHCAGKQKNESAIMKGLK